jgi:hypothetical protein
MVECWKSSGGCDDDDGAGGCGGGPEEKELGGPEFSGRYSRVSVRWYLDWRSELLLLFLSEL